MEAMTAAELHAVYAPLWEAVPETRPAILWEWDYDAQQWTASNPMTGPVWADGDMAATNAALCRVKVEDWLPFQGCVVGMDVGDGITISWTDPNPPPPAVQYRRGWYVNSDGEKFVMDYFPAEPTIHHALVAAALAAAQSQNTLRAERPVPESYITKPGDES